MRSLLLIPSLRSDAFVQYPDLTADEAAEQIVAFQAQAAQRAKADRVAEPFRNMTIAPAQERVRDGVQTLGPFDADELALGDLGFGALDAEDLRHFSEVCQPGLSGRRAVYVTVDDNDQATVLLGTQVSFNENRYTREFWDKDLSAQLNPVAPVALDADFGHAASAADDLNATADELRDIAGTLRKRGAGSLFGATAADPELLNLASRLDAVVIKLVGEPPKADPAPFDVEQVIERGREAAGELFKKGTEVTGDLIKKGEEVTRRTRSLIADILAGRKP